RKSANRQIWVEKTIVKDRFDRTSGDLAFGKALWSPQLDKGGADTYANMRKVKAGDVILHLTDNKAITAVSIAETNFNEGEGIKGTPWEGKAYIIPLKDFKTLKALERSA